LPPTTLDGLLRGRRTLVCGAFGLEYPRPLPASVEMVGPMLPRDEPPLPAEMKTWLDAGPPVVYANMGTLAVAPPGQLSKMREAFAELDARVLWILKAPQAATLPTPVPANVRILGWGPAPLAVLRHPNVRALVSHCGINSVHESLTAGTPIVGIPMFADQLDMAVRVADAGAGLWLDKHQFSPEALRTAIARVLDDETFRARIPPIQAVFARAGGVRRAADLIQQTAQRGQ
jgi:MGT family glycosyltransferase